MQKRVGFFGASGANSGSGIKNVLELQGAGKLPSVSPAVIASCNPSGGVAKIAKDFGVPFHHFLEPYDNAQWWNLFTGRQLNYLVLLGCSIRVIGLHPYFVFNEHPALLSVEDPERPGRPLFGGKGKTDLHVHEAVIAARDKYGITESGTTTHFVCSFKGTDEDYDSGDLFINEHRLALNPDETPTSLQERVKALQRERTPLDIEAVVSGRIRLKPNGSRYEVVRD